MGAVAEVFLRGISQTARAATRTATDIVAMREAHRAALIKSPKALKLLDSLFKQPLVPPKQITEIVGCTHPTAVKLAKDPEARGWLQEVTGFDRNRLYRYQPYLELIHRKTVEANLAAQ